MARKISRDDLLLLLDEMNRGDATRAELQELVVELELLVSDTEAVDLLQDEELTDTEIVDQLVGYSDMDA